MLQFRRFFLLFFLALPTAQSQTNDWWNSNWDYRVSVSVDTGMYPRTEKPVEVAVNFTDFLISQGETGAFDVNSLRVVEVDASGVLINSNDPEVPYQFDPDPAFDATTNAAGTVVFLLDGTTPSNTVRYFHFYIDVIGGISPPPEAPTFADKVIITDDVMDEGQNSIRVETFDNLGALVGTYYYQKQGGGFSSLVDRNGNDWIDYNLNNPLGGAAGDFRGIPNLVFPEGHFHPGALTSVTSLSYDGPLKATIRSKTSDNLWEVTWEIYPNYAKLSVLKTDGNYWFLYEGTPGGLLNVNSDYLVRSDGTQTFLSESWTQDLTGDEWVYFSDPLIGISGRSLFLANHQDDAAIDSYRQLDNAMTVFGFGRSGTTSLLDQIPGYFTIGLIDDTSFNSASSTIFSAYKDLNVVIENIPPVIRSVTSGDPNLINVLFSKELESTTAEDALNYAISDGATVSSATLNAGGQTVVLDTSEMVEGVTYTVTVNNIEDIIGNVIAPNSQATFEFSNQDPDLILDYLLEEGSGTVATDSSGQGNDGALINGPTFTSETVNGSAYSLSFDGTDDYIDAGIFDVNGSGLTLAAWFKADSFPGSSNDPRIISKASGTAANDHVFMLGTVKSSGTVRLRARMRVGGSTTTLIADSGDLATDTWYHAAVTYDGATLSLYLNGTEVGSTALTGPVDNDPTLAVTIGAQPAGSKYFDGLLDDVRILQRGLDVNEIAALIGVNQAPVSFDENYSVTEDTSLSITAPGILVNDSDPDGNALTAALETGVSSGALTLNPDGSFTYTPSANFSGTDSFTYQASDGSLISNASTVTISVSPVNDAPVVINDSYQASPGELLMVDSASGVLANDNDIDLDTLSVVLISDVSNGVLALSADGSFDYTPNTGFGGEDSFTYQASDGEFTAQATVTLLVVVPPTAADDVYNTDEDTTLTVTGASILDNDTSPDGNLLQAALVGDVSNGTLTLNTDGTFDYSPAVDFSGEDSFTYNAVDGITGATASATVTITVTPVNDAPVGVDDSYQLEQDGQITVNAPGVLDNDSDIDGNPLTASLSASVSNGALTLNPDGSFDYTPNAGFLGTDSFTYVVNDGQQDSAEATVSLLVSAADQDNLLEFSLNEGSGMIATDSSGQGNDGALINGPTFTSETVNGSAYSLSFDGVDDYVDAGIFDVSGSGLTLAAWFKADSFPGSSNDPRIISKASGTSANDHVFMLGTTKSSGTVRLRARVRVGGSTTTLIADSGDLATDTWYHAAVTYDGATLSLYLDGTEVGSTALTGPVDNDPTLAVTIGAQPAGSKYFDGLLDDVRILQRGLDVNEIAALIGVNQAPVSFDENYSVTEDTSLSITAPGILANDSDPDGNALTAALETGVSSGALTLNADGSFTYTPSANFSGTDGFTYQASDGSLISNASTVTISVSPVNDAPVVINDSYQASPGELLMVDSASGVLANDNDIDLDTLSVVLISDVSNGVLALSADGSFDYTPNTGFGGEDSFTYQASDGEFTAQATVTLSVVVPPTAADDAYNTDEDTTLTVTGASILDNDTSPDGNLLQAALVSDVSNGTLTLNTDGTFDYSPAVDFSGEDSFTYNAVDGANGATASATVTITVTPVNDAPVGVNDSYQLEQDGQITVNAPGVLDNDSDIDGNPLTASLSTSVSNGALTLNSDGSFDYTPNAGFLGTDSFTYVVNDGQQDSTETTVSLLVSAADPDNLLEFSLDEGSGTVATDSSGQGNDGTLFNAPVYTADTINGSAYSLSFDGTDDYIDAGIFDVNGNGLTLAAWFKADSFPGSSNDPRIISKASGTSANDHVFMLGTTKSSGTVRLRARVRVGGNTTTLIANSGNLATDSWYHAAVTYDGATLRLYLDGTEVGSTALVGTVDTDPTLAVTIGTQLAGSKFFDGLLDDVRILQRGLSSNEITVISAPNRPPIGVNDVYTMAQDTVITINAVEGVLSNDSDPDFDLLSSILLSDTENGVLNLNENGSFDYTPDANFNGTDGFTYYLSDGFLSSTPVTVTINIEADQNAPIGSSDSYNATAGSTLIIDALQGILINDSDPNMLPLISILETNVENGTLTLSENGSFTYNANPGFTGDDIFFYRASNGTQLSVPTQVTISVAPDPNLPIANADFYSTVQDTTLNVGVNNGVLANDTDPNSDVLSVALIEDVSKGTLTINSDGSFIYIPDSGFFGTDKFRYKADDGINQSLDVEVTIVVLQPANSGFQTMPPSGSIYKEFTRIISSGNNWRVTDPNATFDSEPDNNPQVFLPNPQLGLLVDDLVGAIRAEAVIDVWHGHVGTTEKQLIVNSNVPIEIPDLNAGVCYASQSIVTVDVPLEYLVSGNNILEGNSGGQTCFNFNWGQWGWYGITIRVYYDETKPHPTGTITSPLTGESFGEDPLVTADAQSSVGIDRVEFYAYYDGYDTDGDGRYVDYHYNRQRERTELDMDPRDNVGTDTTAPYALNWDTELVPDQEPESIRLVARIRDLNGVYYVTPEVTALSLERVFQEVYLSKPRNVPLNFVVRDGQSKSSNFDIPDGMLTNVVSTKLLIRSWNGLDGNLCTINEFSLPSFGASYYYDYDIIDMPPTALFEGTNTFIGSSSDKGHGLDVLWPGPAVLIRRNRDFSAPTSLTITEIDSYSVQLDWDDHPERAFTGFNLYQGTSPEFPLDETTLISSNIKSSDFLVTGLAENSQYYFAVTAAFDDFGIESPKSDELIATTPIDMVPPRLLSVSALSQTAVICRFNEPVDPTTAQDIANYIITTVNGNVTVVNSNLETDQQTVILTTTSLIENVNYTLTAIGILDTAATQNVSNTSAEFFFLDGLFAHYPCNEGRGITAIDTQDGPDANIFGAVWSNSGANSNASLMFDGIDDYLSLGSPEIAGNELTLSLWFKADNFNISDSRLISKAIGTGASEHNWMISTILVDGEYRLRFRLTAGGASKTLVASSGTLELDVWTHVTAIYDGIEMRLYKDGILVGSTPKTGSLDAGVGVEVAVGNQPPGAGERPFSGMIDDIRIFQSALGSDSLQIVAARKMPLATDDNYITSEDTTLTVDPIEGILANDSDADLDPLTAIIVSDVSDGVLNLNADGSFDYTPNENFNGTDSFTYYANDGSFNSDLATVNFIVNAVNDAPLAKADSYRTSPDTPLVVDAQIGVLANDVDYDLDPLLVTLVGDVTNGVLSLNSDGSFTYTPNLSFTGLDSFTYYANDGQINSNLVTVTLDVAVIDPDLITKLPFDEGNGIVARDLSGKDNSGSLVNGPLYTSETPQGSPYSLSFDGIDDYVDVGKLDANGSGLTLAAWIKADSFPGLSNDPRIISKTSGSSSDDHVFMLGTIQSGSSVRLRGRVRVDGVTTTLIADSGALNTNAWYHAALTYDGTLLRLYLDGIEVGSTALTGAVDTNPNLTVAVGAQPPNVSGKFFDGSIDHVCILQRALTAEEIITIVTGN